MGVFYVNEAGQQISINGLTGHYLKIQNQDGTWIEKQCLSGFQWGLPLNSTYLGVYAKCISKAYLW